MIVDNLFESQEQKQERALFEQWRGVGQTLMELRMSEKQILDLFSRVESGATAAGSNRTMLGKGKDVATNVASTVSNAVKGVLNAVQTSAPVAAVDVAYDQATDALGKLAGGQKGKVMKAIKAYRNLAKQYPKTAGFSKAALVAIAGLATGGAGLPAIAGLTYALDSAIKGDKLSSVLGKGAGAAALAAAGQAISGTTQQGDTISQAPTGAETISQAPTGGQEGQLLSWSQGIAPGDTLSGIAQKYNVSVDELLKANPQITNPDVLKVGDSIQIPTYNFQGDQWGSGLPTYDKGVGTYADTLAKVKSGAYTDSPISRRGLKESLGFVALTLPPEKMIDRKATFNKLRVQENIDLENPSVVLTAAGTYKIFENIDRLQDLIIEARPEFYRPDMPGGPGKKSKPGIIGRGLNWLDKKAGQVGAAAKNIGHQLTTKLTKEKLKMDWHQAGKPSDSNAIASFLIKQGVPQAVVTDVYGQMGLPAPTLPGGPRIPGFINKATGQEWSRDELTAKAPEPTPAANAFGQMAKQMKATGKSQRDAQRVKPSKISATGGTINKSVPGVVAHTASPQQAAAQTASTTPAWADPTSGQYVGRREVARRQAAQQPAKATPNFAPQQGYSSVKMNAPAYTGVPRVGATAAPAIKTTPVAPKVPGAPKMSPAEYIKKIGAPALPESIVNNVSKMLESVKSKKDVTMIREYIDTNLTQSYQQEFRRALHEKVTVAAALRRRIAAQQAAQ